jgi:LemA protein
MPLLIALILVFVFIVAAFFIGYNRLIQMRNVITRTFAQVDTYLQKRADLIPALIEVTRGYAKHERGVLTNIAESRARAAYSQDTSGRGEDEKGVAKDIKRILALREAYPDLKANEEFLKLMDELELVEAQIAEQREAFNNVVKVYNDFVGTFPTSYVAQLTGFPPADYFDFGADARALPGVRFPSEGEEDLIELGSVGDE